MKTRVLVAIALSVVCVRATCGQDTKEAEESFRRGAALMRQHKYSDAIPFLKDAEKAFPTNASVLWNLGIAQADVGNHKEALDVWQRYRRVEPDDWKAIPKLVQAYQALGDRPARDREILALQDLKRKANDAELARAEKFCREQFVAAEQKVFAFQMFEPKGSKPVYYRFSVVDAKGNESFYISVGSYDSTTEVARELGEVPKTGRLYHLDRYEGKNHQSFVFWKVQPEYEVARKAVVEILEGKRRPVSASSREVVPPLAP
jgi:tetratricopeptide (TPR) repeat protein